MVPHEVLGVSPDATREEIRRRYHALILQYHPDRSDAPDAADRTQAVTEAYHALMGRDSGDGSRAHHIRKQAAKYHRKDPTKKGRAARKAARKAAKAKRPKRVDCGTCGGRGSTTRTRTVLGIMKRTEEVICPDCAGQGYVVQ